VLCFVNLGVYRPFSPIWDAAGLLNKWPGSWPLLDFQLKQKGAKTSKRRHIVILHEMGEVGAN
jgi:hypothetical protein